MHRSYEVRTTLSSQFSVRSNARIFQLRAQLHIIIKESVSIHQYYSRIKVLAMLLEQLEAICQYDSVVVNITSRAHPTLVSKVYSMLLNQENRKKQNHALSTLKPQ